jgi:hypothetical protein
MKKQNFLSLLVIAAGFTFFGTSCTTTTESNAATDAALTTTATDEAQAASLSDVVINVADANINTLAANGYSIPQAVKGIFDSSVMTITIDKPDSTNFPKIITIDYGTTGYIDSRNDTLKGKIIVTISGKLWKSGSTKTIRTVDFYVNDNNIKGVKVITDNGLNAAKDPSMTEDVSDTIILVDKSTIIRNSTRTRVRIDDNGTPKIFWDDKFSITGSTTGINAKGVAYTVEITNPLIIYNNYKFFVQGTISTTTQSRTAILDYGDGTKDNKATLTINGVTKNIKLKN